MVKQYVIAILIALSLSAGNTNANNTPTSQNDESLLKNIKQVLAQRPGVKLVDDTLVLYEKYNTRDAWTYVVPAILCGAAGAFMHNADLSRDKISPNVIASIETGCIALALVSLIKACHVYYKYRNPKALCTLAPGVAGLGDQLVDWSDIANCDIHERFIVKGSQTSPFHIGQTEVFAVYDKSGKKKWEADALILPITPNELKSLIERYKALRTAAKVAVAPKTNDNVQRSSTGEMK